MRSTPHELEELLAHGPWVRALARSLVRDASRADDLAQQAWLKALEQPPAPSGSARGWFATVLRNLARQEHRAESRRATREQLAATDGPEALGVTLELAQQLARAVAELEEPYRSAIFRRYYEGLAPRRIAALDAVPLKTVKTRLARGLEKLRERLDREHGGERGAWVAACLPLVRIQNSALLLGGIAMNVKLACVAAALVLVGAWAVLRGSGAAVAELPGAPADSSSSLAALETGIRQPGDSRSDARAATSPGASSAATCPYPQQVRELAGCVVDPHGVPMSGVRLFFVKPEQALQVRQAFADTPAIATAAQSDALGRFSVKTRLGTNLLMGERAGWVTLLGCDVWSTDGQKELLVVMAPRVEISGVIVDEQGRPIGGANARISAGPPVRGALGRESDTAVEIPWTARSDERGRFAIEGAPGLASAILTAFDAHHAEASIAMPEVSRSDLRFVLAQRESTVIAGEVLEPNGLPVPAALVGMGQLTTRCDANGRFELELKTEHVAGPDGTWRSTLAPMLSAVKPGRLPARMAEPPTGWPAFVTLVIGGEPLSIRGRVLDASGRPQPGVEVRPADEHVLGMVPGVGEAAFPRTLEGLMRASDEMETPTSTDLDGSFVLRGLLDETYALRAFDPETLRLVVGDPVRAGNQTVELRFPAAAGLERVAGRVLSLRGDPLPGVMLSPSRPALGALLPLAFGRMRTTDSAGRFDFGEIATEGLELQIMGEGLQTLVGWKAPAGAKLSELELRAPRRCHLQVDLGDRPELADQLVVLDEQGRPLELWTSIGNASTFGMSNALRDGKSEVLGVAENAAFVILEKQGQEVQRRPVSLRPGGVATVRF